METNTIKSLVHIVYVCKLNSDISFLYNDNENEHRKSVLFVEDCDDNIEYEAKYYIKYICENYPMLQKDSYMAFLNDRTFFDKKKVWRMLEEVTTLGKSKFVSLSHTFSTPRVEDYELVERMWGWHFETYFKVVPIPSDKIVNYELYDDSLFIVKTECILSIPLEAWRHWLAILEDKTLVAIPRFDEFHKVFKYSWHHIFGEESQRYIK